MKFSALAALLLALLFQRVAVGQVESVDPFIQQDPYIQQGPVIQQGPFVGGGSVGSYEPLYFYDDQEPWKHGYIKVMPYYGGFHSFRPYNYHHVFGQSTTAQSLGMSPVMPYSQQFWHRYEAMTDLSHGNHEPVFPNVEPTEGPLKRTIPAPPEPADLGDSTYSPPVVDKQSALEAIQPLQFQSRETKALDAPRPFVAHPLR